MFPPWRSHVPRAAREHHDRPFKSLYRSFRRAAPLSGIAEPSHTARMRNVSASIERDVLSEVLDSVHFRSTVICRSELAAPWGFAIPAREQASSHIVLRGRCCFELESGEQARLQKGDMVVVPRGTKHTLKDAPSSPVMWLEDLAAQPPRTRRADTVLVCGAFHFEKGAANPLLVALPQLLVVRGGRKSVDAWLRGTFEFLASESNHARPGADTIVTRLADILFVQAVREYFASP